MFFFCALVNEVRTKNLLKKIVFQGQFIVTGSKIHTVDFVKKRNSQYKPK